MPEHPPLLHASWCNGPHAPDAYCFTSVTEIIAGVNVWVTSSREGAPILVVDEDGRYVEVPLLTKG